ncbi:hypothetical protein L9F63_004091 [Diploptera punctata]|uniref:Uncharacterized protein n=1 Tax=Diploptera punctata TaxID=6984 RepID=A0AAD7ZGT0_DIPPU|nr:hypothetical protein L9F63_004091 [Diploptera punctata]
MNEVIRNKTADVDGQLTAEIQAQLRQKQETSKPVSEKLVASKQEKEVLNTRYSENDSKEALCKLSEMQM